jgi:hypothetical protein
MRRTAAGSRGRCVGRRVPSFWRNDLTAQDSFRGIRSKIRVKTWRRQTIEGKKGKQDKKKGRKCYYCSKQDRSQAKAESFIQREEAIGHAGRPLKGRGLQQTSRRLWLRLTAESAVSKTQVSASQRTHESEGEGSGSH